MNDERKALEKIQAACQEFEPSDHEILAEVTRIVNAALASPESAEREPEASTVARHVEHLRRRSLLNGTEIWDMGYRKALDDVGEEIQRIDRTRAAEIHDLAPTQAGDPDA